MSENETEKRKRIIIDRLWDKFFSSLSFLISLVICINIAWLVLIPFGIGDNGYKVLIILAKIVFILGAVWLSMFFPFLIYIY